MTQKLTQLIAAYIATGRIVFVYPRLQRISLNGGARMTFAEAAAKMRAVVL